MRLHAGLGEHARKEAQPRDLPRVPREGALGNLTQVHVVAPFVYFAIQVTRSAMSAGETCATSGVPTGENMCCSPG